MRILIVDDEVAIVELVKASCRRDGHLVETCISSVDAWDQLGAHTFDLLITDIAMEPLDGLALVREARRLQPHLMAIAITGYSARYTLPEVLAAGATDLMFKPLQMDELRARVALADGRRRADPLEHRRALETIRVETLNGFQRELDQVRQSIVAGEQSVKVLLVEDDPRDTQLLRRMLSDKALGIFAVTQVERLGEAVAYLATHPVDIVLLDLGLPDAVGLDTVRRAHAAAPNVPLVVLTGSTDRAMAVLALQEGAQDYLVKGAVANHSLQWVLHYAIERHRLLAEREQIRKRQLEIKDELQAHELRVKDEFLSHVSHELRTPLAAIDWFTTNLLDGLLGDVNAEQREHLETTLKNANQLKSMISDLLDSTRADTGKLSVALREMILGDVVAEALATCHARAAAAGVVFRAAIPSGLPPVWADPDRTRQVLINLLDNSIKFTPQDGIITVQLQIADDPDFLCTSVADAGCGITQENRERVFERLFQESSGADYSRKGLGLGLFISKELVSLQGGRIWVESEIGQGATFSFTLPVFSLRRLCAPVLSARHLQAGAMTLITVETFPGDETAETKAHRLRDSRKVLEGCILAGQDLLLPRMFGPKSSEPFFILAGTDRTGAAVMELRIQQRLAHDLFRHNAKQAPAVSVTVIECPTPAESDLEHTVTHLVSRLNELVTATVSAER
jgi:signal transduction histidine kinase